MWFLDPFLPKALSKQDVFESMGNIQGYKDSIDTHKQVLVTKVAAEFDEMKKEWQADLEMRVSHRVTELQLELNQVINEFEATKLTCDDLKEKSRNDLLSLAELLEQELDQSNKKCKDLIYKILNHSEEKMEIKKTVKMEEDFAENIDIVIEDSQDNSHLSDTLEQVVLPGDWNLDIQINENSIGLPILGGFTFKGADSDTDDLSISSEGESDIFPTRNVEESLFVKEETVSISQVKSDDNNEKVEITEDQDSLIEDINGTEQAQGSVTSNEDNISDELNAVETTVSLLDSEDEQLRGEDVEEDSDGTQDGTVEEDLEEVVQCNINQTLEDSIQEDGDDDSQEENVEVDSDGAEQEVDQESIDGTQEDSIDESTEEADRESVVDPSEYLELKQENNELNNQLSELTDELIDLKDLNNELNDELTELNHQVNELNNQLTELKHLNNQLNNELTELKDENETLNDKLEQLKLDKKEEIQKMGETQKLLERQLCQETETKQEIQQQFYHLQELFSRKEQEYVSKQTELLETIHLLETEFLGYQTRVKQGEIQVSEKMSALELKEEKLRNNMNQWQEQVSQMEKTFDLALTQFSQQQQTFLKAESQFTQKEMAFKEEQLKNEKVRIELESQIEAKDFIIDQLNDKLREKETLGDVSDHLMSEFKQLLNEQKDLKSTLSDITEVENNMKTMLENVFAKIVPNTDFQEFKDKSLEISRATLEIQTSKLSDFKTHIMDLESKMETLGRENNHKLFVLEKSIHEAETFTQFILANLNELNQHYNQIFGSNQEFSMETFVKNTLHMLTEYKRTRSELLQQSQNFSELRKEFLELKHLKQQVIVAPAPISPEKQVDKEVIRLQRLVKLSLAELCQKPIQKTEKTQQFSLFNTRLKSQLEQLLGLEKCSEKKIISHIKALLTGLKSRDAKVVQQAKCMEQMHVAQSQLVHVLKSNLLQEKLDKKLTEQDTSMTL